MKKFLSILLSTIILVSSWTFVSAQDAAGAKVLNWVAPGEVTTFDSGKTYDVISSEEIGFIVEPLYRLNSNNEALPALAVAAPEISEDGLTVTFSIRDNAAFSDGTPIVAADVVYAAQRVVNPATGSQSAKNLSYIKNASEIVDGTLPVEDLGIKALSDTEIEITLVAPNPFIDKELTTVLLAPVNKEFAEAQGENYALTSDNLLSSGPYVLEGWNGTDISWQFVKNPYFWDAENIYFDQINIQVIKDVATGVNLYEAGQLDAARITGDYITLYEGDPDVVTVQTLRATNVELGISSNELLQNLNLRKALSLSIDREELARDILNGDGIPAVGVIPNGIAVSPVDGKSIAEDFGVLVYTDIAEAQTLFAAALEELGVDSIELRLVTSDNDESIKIGQYLQSVWETNLEGLKIDLANVPSSVRFEEMMSYKFDLALGGWTGDYNPTSYVKQHETSYEHNHSQWVSDELTTLVNALEKDDGNDFELRWQHLREANQYLIDNAVLIPLVQAAKTYLVNPKLKGYETHVLGTEIDITHYAYFEE